MRDPNRIDEVLREIGIIWHKHPDMRLGQLIGNVLEGASLYYVEDAGLVSALKDTYENAHENVCFDDDAYVFDIIKKHPGELGFVLQESDYKAYKETYVSAGLTSEDAELTEPEFNALKAYFDNKE